MKYEKHFHRMLHRMQNEDAFDMKFQFKSSAHTLIIKFN